MVRTVFFDVGETILDESRHWGRWPERLGVSRLTFFAALGAVIERGWHHRRVFELVAPGFDIEAQLAKRRPADEIVEPEDLYPDAAPCLAALRSEGYRVGLAGNQPHWIEGALAKLGLEVDVIASSAGWGVEKPSAEFFARVVAEADCAPGEIAYVGDRLDNDVLPARAAGMVAVFLRRGPWGVVHATRPEAARAHLRIESLAELPAALRGLSFAPPADA